MFTLDEIKAILDADDATTVDGYNLVRTNLMTKLSPALTEWEDLKSENARIREENDRLKQANATLYSKIETQIMGKPDANDRSGDPAAEDPENTEPTAEEKLDLSVKDYAAEI